jgi:hypothetical protein
MLSHTVCVSSVTANAKAVSSSTVHTMQYSDSRWPLCAIDLSHCCCPRLTQRTLFCFHCCHYDCIYSSSDTASSRVLALLFPTIPLRRSSTRVLHITLKARSSYSSNFACHFRVFCRWTCARAYFYPGGMLKSKISEFHDTF